MRVFVSKCRSERLTKLTASVDLNKNMPKKMIIQQKFREDYAEKYPCFVKSSVSVHHARCKVCSMDRPTELETSEVQTSDLHFT